MNSLIESLKNNKHIYEIGVFINMRFADLVTVPFQKIKIKLRRWNFIDKKRYSKLRNLKNTHKGERCFIIATGPSLTFEDLALLKNETTFCVNSIVKVLDKLDYVPNYIGIQDAFVFEKIGKQIEECSIENVFLTPNLYKKISNPNKKNYYQFPHFSPLGGHPERRKCKFFFSDKADEVIYDGNSITYSLLQIAVYMGFCEIYLLGCDCSYIPVNGKQYFVESGHIDKQAISVGERMIQAFATAKKWIEENRPDVKIYNSTRGGMLEVFPRKTVDMIFGK